MDNLNVTVLIASIIGWVGVSAVISLFLHHVLKTKVLPPVVWWLGLFLSLLVFLPAPEIVVSQFGQLEWVTPYQSQLPLDAVSLHLLEINNSLFNAELFRSYGVLSLLSGLVIVSFWRLVRLYRNYRRVALMVTQSTPVRSHLCAWPIYLTPFKDSAFVIGLFKPAIALPDYFFRLSSEQQITVLAHEQTHIRSSDHLAKFLWRVLIDVFWFNPFLQNLERGFNQSMEHRCDKRTLQDHDFMPCDYARTLLQCLKLSGDARAMNTLVGFSAKEGNFRDIKKRMTLILEPSGHSFPVKRIAVLLLALASTIVSVNSAFAAFLMFQEPWIYPVSNPRLTSGFGHVAKLRAYKPHQGIDLRGPKGTPIYASGSGKVMIADDESLPGGYGKVVVIQHPGGWQSLYAHLDGFAVLAGDTVQQGDIIGAMGETGRASGVHLHFELAFEGKPVDPLEVIQAHEQSQSLML